MSRYAPIELLRRDHDRSIFDCGSTEQTDWLRRYALLAQEADTARVYVARRENDARVAGFYALSAGGVEPADAPRRLAAGAGRHPIPVAILARLGVDLDDQHRGLGTALLRDALLQTVSVANRVGVRALLIHAESPDAAAFYLRFDPAFERSPTDPLHLALLMKNIRAGIRRTQNAQDDSAVSDG